MAGNNNSSTLKSVIDSATGTAKSLYGSVVGSDERHIEGEAQKKKGSLEDDASHATAKIGPFSTTGSGGLATDSEDRTKGSWNQTIGSTKEAIGGVVGSASLKQSGQDQHREGEAQEAKGRAEDYTSGVADRVTGAVGGAVSSLTGNRDSERQYQSQHDEGKARQRGVEHDVGKEADAKADEVSRKAEEAKN